MAAEKRAEVVLWRVGRPPVQSPARPTAPVGYRGATCHHERPP